MPKLEVRCLAPGKYRYVVKDSKGLIVIITTQEHVAQAVFSRGKNES